MSLQKAQLNFLNSVIESVCCSLFLFEYCIELSGFLLGFTEDARKKKNYFMKNFFSLLETSCSSLSVVTGLSPTSQPSVDLWGCSVHLMAHQKTPMLLLPRVWASLMIVPGAYRHSGTKSCLHGKRG